MRKKKKSLAKSDPKKDRARRLKAKERRSTICGFAQVLHYARLADFDKMVKEDHHDAGSKGFSSRAMLISLIYSQVSGSDSLREIENGLTALGGGLNHLGLPKASPRSSLAYALKQRDPATIERFGRHLYHHFNSRMPNSRLAKRFPFKGPVFSLDASVIALCLDSFDWALYRTKKGGCKLHTLLNNRNLLPVLVVVTEAKTHDSQVTGTIDESGVLVSGAIVIVDRGYIDYDQFNAWNERGVFFVTRTKTSMNFRIVEHRPVPAPVGRPPASPDEAQPKSRVLSDTVVECGTRQSASKYPGRLRVVKYWDEEQGRELEFLTNNFKLSPVTIAGLYKDRWAIESFFRWIKQNLFVKSFLGTSYNAVMSQLWAAIITVMILKYLHYLCREGWAMSQFAHLVRLLLASYVDLLESIKIILDTERPPPQQPVMVADLLAELRPA